MFFLETISLPPPANAILLVTFFSNNNNNKKTPRLTLFKSILLPYCRCAQSFLPTTLRIYCLLFPPSWARSLSRVRIHSCSSCISHLSATSNRYSSSELTLASTVWGILALCHAQTAASVTYQCMMVFVGNGYEGLINQVAMRVLSGLLIPVFATMRGSFNTGAAANLNTPP